VEPISNADRIVAILRQRLRDSAKAEAGKSRETSKRGAPPVATGLAALATLGGANPAQLRRACIQALLAEQMGQQLLNDAHFQQVVGRVTEAIENDEAAAQLLDRVIADLKAS
jgi:hypothetical protein